MHELKSSWHGIKWRSRDPCQKLNQINILEHMSILKGSKLIPKITFIITCPIHVENNREHHNNIFLSHLHKHQTPIMLFIIFHTSFSIQHTHSNFHNINMIKFHCNNKGINLKTIEIHLLKQVHAFLLKIHDYSAHSVFLQTLHPITFLEFHKEEHIRISIYKTSKVTTWFISEYNDS